MKVSTQNSMNEEIVQAKMEIANSSEEFGLYKEKIQKHLKNI